MRRFIFLIVLSFTTLLFPRQATAQEKEAERRYLSAIEAYETGHFEVVDSLLSDYAPQLVGPNRVEAYRILSHCGLYLDKPEDAERYAKLLLAEEPYYTSALDDSPRFIDIISKLKKGRATTISTASQQAETIEEVPVPITLITEQMLLASGARTISEALQLFVPGISLVAGLEDNIAMHGVYSISQSTILVMIDGHRLNSHTTNAEALDYRISLDKVRQIEVLRGPASSLYGNVALSAVVNIITQNGSDLDSNRVALQLGSFGSRGFSIMRGKGTMQSDYLAWASIYTSEGQKDELFGRPHYRNGYNGKPAFDLGTRMRWDDFSIEVVGQHAKQVPYNNLISLDTCGYTYDKYGKYDGEHPGMSRTNIRADLDYSHSWDNLLLSVNTFATYERSQLYNVLGDSIDSVTSKLLQAFMSEEEITEDYDPVAHTSGIWQTMQWESYTFGATTSLGYQYQMRNGMHGSLLGGLQYEFFSLTDDAMMFGCDYNKIYDASKDRITIGDEHTFSTFLQLKHNFSKQFIFNGGLRYDFKLQYNNDKLNSFSPRLALIWLPNESFSLKAGYAHSFVDAPYLYRANKISLISGAEPLKPEKLDSYHLTAHYNWQPKHLSYEASLLYNVSRDLLYFDIGTSVKQLFSNLFEKGLLQIGGTIVNAGEVDMLALEQVLQYNTDKTMLNLNVSWQQPFHVVDLSNDQHSLFNVPNVLANLTASQQIFKSKKAGSLWVRGNVHFQTSSKNKKIMRLDLNEFANTILFLNQIALYHPEKLQEAVETAMNMVEEKMTKSKQEYERQPAYAVAGLGIEWHLPFGLKASVDAYNLFNQDYKIGSNIISSVPQQGRAFNFKLTYDF